MKIQDALDGRVNNFTLMRLLAALGVLFFHCFALSIGPNVADAYHPIFKDFVLAVGRFAVDMFFVISGFLVTASYVNKADLMAFIEARILRVFPALIVVNLFCILVVGALATSEPLIYYLTSSETISFFKQNVFLLGGIQLNLPGVFTSNPYPIHVNGSLWTLPIELMMYFWVALLGVCSVLQSVRVSNLFCILIALLYAQAPEGQFFIVNEVHHARVAFLFLLGGFFYINRKIIPLSFSCLAGLGGGVYLAAQFEYYFVLQSVFFTYLVLICAFHPLLRLPTLDRWGDISYGVYIYAFPVQQLIAHFLSGIMPMQMLALALPTTCMLAIMSWYFIEQPALKMKGRVSYTWFYKRAGNE